MRQKELRLALVCYGGISLAIYMHGVTKEVWKLARASRAFHADGGEAVGVERVYVDMLAHIAKSCGVGLRVLPDIIAGASAGGLNGIFLAQAIHSGQSLEPLTRLWLERADVDVLLDPDARVWTGFAKHWAVPIVRRLIDRPDDGITQSVAPETRAEVRAKLSRLVRSRWLAAPFGGLGFAQLLAEALDAMAAEPAGAPLLPPGHPLDLFTTATDYAGHGEPIALNSPRQVIESEHRVSIGFNARTPRQGGKALAPLAELVLAGRATASFPGAFPPLTIGEIDAMMAQRGEPWPSRDAFLARVLPAHSRAGPLDRAALIDGSVLVNAPFAEAMAVLQDRPAHREVDRRLVYLDPLPKGEHTAAGAPKVPGFVSVIFAALSTIPRAQPIRDNLEHLAKRSRDHARLSKIVAGLRPEVERQVEHLFGHTLVLARPTPQRLSSWRAKAQAAAARQAGYAYQAYARIKVEGTLDAACELLTRGIPDIDRPDLDREAIRAGLAVWAAQALPMAPTRRGDLAQATVDFLRTHDLAHRIRRLRQCARRLGDAEAQGLGASAHEIDAARDAIWRALALYFHREGLLTPGDAARARHDPAGALAALGKARTLREADDAADAVLAEAMADMSQSLRRFTLLTYLGFAFYDVATFPLLRDEGLTEMDPVKVDRIAPEDAPSIRRGGAAATLRGQEFYNFGAFFSRAYRENDYLWGRLHGAERMADFLASAAPGGMDAAALRGFKRALFLAALDEEQGRLTADPALISGIRAEVIAQL